MVNDVSQDVLRRLAAHRNGAVLSLFLDLDPSRLPTAPARQSAVDALLHEARRAVEGGGLEAGVRDRLREALTEIEGRLRPSAIPVEGARGLAVFAPGPEAPVEVLRLPAPIANLVVLDVSAHVEPLVSLADRARWCVALVDRASVRFHLGNEDAMTFSGSLEDEVNGRDHEGGWGPGRYEREVEHELGVHLDHVADALALAWREGRYDRLLLAGQQPLRHELERRLHRGVRERLAGWVDLDLSTASAETVRAAAAPRILAAREEHEREVLERLTLGTGTPGGHGVAGLRTTLGALSERRVQTLVVDPVLRSPGSRCPDCGFLGLHLAECPADGAEMEQLENVIEAAVALAYEQAAEVVLPAPAPQLAAVDGIGAITRF